jgi:hypothetical protein
MARPAPTPPIIPVRSTQPPSRPAPGAERVPTVAPPVAGFLPTQAAPPAQTPPRPAGAQTLPPAPQPATSWQNVKLDVTISDSLNVDTQTTKTVSMLILDGRSGQIRSTSSGGLINIDASPSVRPDGRIYLRLTVEYRPELSAAQAQQAGTSRIAQFNESLALIVANGKPILASQSADPRGDRKVSLEVTATVAR